jgi:penicillin-binding protein 1A
MAEPLKVVNRLDTDENQAAAYYVEELRKEILALGDQKKLEGIDGKPAAEKAFLEGGLSIRSTLDSNLQLIAQTALRAGLETYDRRHGWRGPVGKIEVTDEFEQGLKDFANNKDNKPKIAGGGNTWQLAVVRSVAKDAVRLGLASGDTGTLSADDAKWAAPLKRDGGGTGLKAGDVIQVSRDPTPDVSSPADHGLRRAEEGADNAPWRLRQVPALQGALVAMDPHTGRVFAMAGGYSFERSSVQPRDPGEASAGLVVQAVRLCGGDGAGGPRHEADTSGRRPIACLIFPTCPAIRTRTNATSPPTTPNSSTASPRCVLASRNRVTR